MYRVCSPPPLRNATHNKQRNEKAHYEKHDHAIFPVHISPFWHEPTMKSARPVAPRNASSALLLQLLKGILQAENVE